MLGLLLKDLYTLKKQGLIMVFILIFYLFFGIINDSPQMLLIFLLVFSVMLPLTAMAYDEKNQCDRLFLCMPVTRRELVSERYLLGLLLTICSNLVGIISILTIFREERLNNFYLLEMIWAFCLIYFAICFPAALKFGVEKSRYIMFILIFLPAIVIPLLFTNEHFAKILKFFTQHTTLEEICLLTIIAGILIFCISWLFSLRLYERKEL